MTYIVQLELHIKTTFKNIFLIKIYVNSFALRELLSINTKIQTNKESIFISIRGYT